MRPEDLTPGQILYNRHSHESATVVGHFFFREDGRNIGAHRGVEVQMHKYACKPQELSHFELSRAWSVVDLTQIVSDRYTRTK